MPQDARVKSFTPLNQLISVQSSGSRAIALIVRSRRSRSCSRVTSAEKRSDKTPIAGPGLALGAGKCVFLARLRMQEDREVFAHCFVTLGGQRVGLGSHDDPIAFAHRQAEEFIADRAADKIGLHVKECNERGERANW